MQYRHLGRSGLQVSALSLGAWITYGRQVGDEVATACMREAFDAGVNFFDNAEVYASGNAESVMGRVIKKLGWKRSDLVLSTKIFWGGEGPNDRGLSRKHIVEGLDAALGRLGTEYVDLVYCHRPDVQTPIEETVRAMSHVIDRGKALYWGTSEWSAQQISEAYGVARRERLVAPTMEQPQYNMLHRERVEQEYLPLYRGIGLGTTVWSPLAGGLLTGKYNGGMPAGTRATLEGFEWLRHRYVGDVAARNIEKVRRLEPLARELDASLAQLALAWVLKNPNVSTAITGATRPEQVRDNLGALRLVERLDDGVMQRIEEVLDNRPAPPSDYRA